MENKVCLDCKEPIVGRSDKKFCSDMCRNNYHNRQNSETTNYVRRIDHLLKKNRRILKALAPDGKIKTHLKKMQKAGFNFEFYTNTYTTKVGQTYYFVYEYGYLPIGNDYYAIVLRDI